MSEKADLLQGIRLGDHVKRICGKCKHRAGIQDALCSKCGSSLASPTIMPSFKEAVESALHYALSGQLSIDARGDISGTLNDWPQVIPYLKQTAAISGLEASIAFGFPRLFTEADSLIDMYGIESRLRPCRAFLSEQLGLTQRSLARLRDQLVENPLGRAVKDYTALYREYSREATKLKADIGEGSITSSLEAIGKRLAGILGRIDDLVLLLKPGGPFWALYEQCQSSLMARFAGSEWNAMLEVISNIASFPLSFKEEK